MWPRLDTVSDRPATLIRWSSDAEHTWLHVLTSSVATLARGISGGLGAVQIEIVGEWVDSDELVDALTAHGWSCTTARRRRRWGPFEVPSSLSSHATGTLTEWPRLADALQHAWTATSSRAPWRFASRQAAAGSERARSTITRTSSPSSRPGHRIMRPSQHTLRARRDADDRTCRSDSRHGLRDIPPRGLRRTCGQGESSQRRAAAMMPTDHRWSDWFKATGRYEVALLLFVGWDPIGINEDVATWDEYESYAWPVVRLISQDCSDSEFVTFLQAIADEVIEIGEGPTLEFARLLRRWVRTSVAVWTSDRPSRG